MDISTNTAFYIDDWLVEPRLNQISNQETTQHLDPRTMQVLVCLAARAGDVVQRDELFDVVWQDVVVNENTLSSAVARLRKTLGDDWKNPRYIETISKSGYRLIAPVRRTGVAPAPSFGDGLPTLTVTPRSGDPPSPPRAPRKTFLSPVTLASFVVLLGAASLWYINPFAADGPQLPLDPVPLSTLPGLEIGATLSPDGQQVAFMWEGLSQDNWDIYIKPVGGDNAVRFTNEAQPEGFPAWSPDGHYLAYATGDPATNECSLFRTPALGGPRVRLGTCGFRPDGLAWSPDGQHLALSTAPSAQEPIQLFLIDIATQEQRALTTPPGATSADRDPTFSPDGQHLAFRRRRPASGQYDLFIVPLDGSTEPQQLTFDRSASINGLDWTPDGKALLFSSNRHGRYTLWQISRSGGEPTRLPLNDYGISALRSARETPRLIYRTRRDETDIWRLSLPADINAPGTPTLTLSSTREDLNPQFSADGQRIAFTSKRTGHYELWTGNLDGTDLIRHTDFKKGALVETPRWTPDGQEILFSARPEGQADLYLVGAESRTPRRLTNGPYDEINGRFSRDGRHVYFSTNQTGRWEIWRMPASGGPAEQVTQRGGLNAQEGPEGKVLYFVKSDTLGLWQMPVDGGPEAVFIPDMSHSHWGNWQVTASGIYFMRRGTGTIAFHDFATGEVTLLYKPAKSLPFIGPSLAVSPDEKTLLFVQIERSEDELMMVDL